MIDFKEAARLGLAHVREWLPDGHLESGQWVFKNPTRRDNKKGSLRVNLSTGQFNDYADEDFRGRDAVTLYAKIHDMRNIDAAKEIFRMYDPFYFPSDDDVDYQASWYQLERGHKNPPPCRAREYESERWELHTSTGRVCCIIIRDIRDGKVDYPYTLWTDGKAVEWRCKGLPQYPLCNSQELKDKQNAPVILYEGQKVPSMVKELFKDREVVVTGWYGGSNSLHKTDLEPLRGRQVWYCFDADNAGRKTVKKEIFEELNCVITFVHPPLNVCKGWDHADAIGEGWTADELFNFIFQNKKPVIGEPKKLEFSSGLSRLEESISQDEREIILDNLTYESKNKKTGDIEKTFDNDWMIKIIDLDHNIKNCVKFDYTIGTKQHLYSNSEILEAELERRLFKIGISANIATESRIKKILRHVQRGNQNYNRCFEFMTELKETYQEETEDNILLNEFMFCFDFAENDKRELYFELFDKFFLRMHARIKGTLRINGGYPNAIEQDIVPILESKQGIGKTTFCMWLVGGDPSFYVDLGSGLSQQIGSAETIKKIRGRIITEIGEMKGSNDAERVKSLISQKVAAVDVKYVENSEDIPLTNSWIGTSNLDEYLFDHTGNRRFYPVRLNNINKKYMYDNPELPLKLHAHYARKVASMSKGDIYKYCTASKELDEFMDMEQAGAMVKTGDYSVCYRAICHWIDNIHIKDDFIDHATISKIASDIGFDPRITSRSFNQAAKALGFARKKIRNERTGSYEMKFVREQKQTLL